MSDDIASLGLSVDSKPVDRARDSLGRFTAAAKEAEGQAGKTSDAFGKAASWTEQLADAIAKAQEEAEKLSKSNEAPEQLGEGLGKAGDAAKLSGNQIAELGHIARSTFGVLLAGGSIFQALGYEANRLVSVLTIGPGGVGGTLKAIGGLFVDLGKWIAGFIVPLTAATAAAIAFVGAAALVGASWSSAQSEIKVALQGIGSAAGITADDINAIAFASASTGKQTVGDARDIAIALAKTGKVSADVAAQIVDLSKGYSDFFGTNAQDTADQLARAFEDPAKGVDDLNKKLGAFDYSTQQNIKSLATQNNLMAAQKALAAGIAPVLETASENTSSWSKAWDAVYASASKYWAKAGKAVDDLAGYNSKVEQLDAALASLALAQTAAANAFTSDIRDKDLQAVAALQAQVRSLTAELTRTANAGRQTAQNLESIRIGTIIDQIDPFAAGIRKAKDELADLTKAANDPALVKSLGGADVLNRSIGLLQSQIEFRKRDVDLAKQQYQDEVAAINARTNAEKAEAAFQAALHAAQNDGAHSPEEAQQVAEIARRRTIVGLEKEQNDAIRDRVFANQQSVDSAQLELSLVGQNIGEQTRLRTQFQLLAAAKEEAFRTGGVVSQKDIDSANKTADALGKLAEDSARANAVLQSTFDRAQLGRSDIDQAVYSKLQSAGLLVNGQITDAQTQALAGQLRLNEELQRSIDIEKGFASDFLHDMLQGKSAAEALGNALENLASKILDNSLNTLFAGLTGSGATGGKGLFGGNILPGILHAGGDVGSSAYPRRSVSPLAFLGAPRFHDGVANLGLRPDEQPAILQKGETVLPRGFSMGGGGVSISVPVSVVAPGADAATLQALTNEVVQLQRSLPTQVLKIVRQGQADRRI